MKIVVLDGYCLNPGDLSWEELKPFGEVTIHERTPEQKILERSLEAEILLTNKTPVSKDIIDQAKELKYIGLLATGYNVVDIEAAKAKGVVVTNVPTYGTASVAQMVFAHILNFTQHVAHHNDTVKQGRWCDSEDFCYWDFPLVELADLTLGLVGLGRIGLATARLGLAFGMKVMAADPYVTKSPDPRIKMTELEPLFQEADFVSLHCPLTEHNQGLISGDALKRMKKSAVLINTSRGPLVDEAALAQALNQGTIAGACLDVLNVEPPTRDNPLFKAKNCWITPHIAWANKAARRRLMGVVIENIRAFVDNAPQNVVNG